MSGLAMYLWQGRVLVFAELPDLPWHKHQAAGICISLDPEQKPLQIQLEEDGPWMDFSAIRVPPRRGHAFRFHGQPAAFLFFDPGSGYFAKTFGTLSDPAEWPAAEAVVGLPAVLRLWWAHQNNKEENENEAAILAELNRIPYAGAEVSIQELYGDSRIREVVQTILNWDDPDSAPGIDLLAEISGLSPSRLAHLFQEQVGIPIRSLRTWFRLKTATCFIKAGASLTDAALAAGFFDQSHFTRTFRDMFGIPPSRVFGRDPNKLQWYIEAEELTRQIAGTRPG